MKIIKILLLSIFIFPLNSHAQDLDSEWVCLYSTIDAQPNATGNRTIAVGTYGEDDFVALVYRFDENPNENFYMVAYRDADSLNGRLGNYQYGGTGQYTAWINGFDQTFFNEAKDLTTLRYDDKDIVMVANNDLSRNIIAYEITADSFQTYPLRMSTGDLPIWAIDNDASNHVFVTVEGDSSTAGSILVYDSPANESAWSAGHSASPLHEITVPEAGSLRGIAVNEEGTVIYVSNYTARKVYCYTGDVENGYTLYNGFSFEITDFVDYDGDIHNAGPWGLKMMPGTNILFVASALNFVNTRYEYGKVFLLNPNDGSVIDTIDCAQWNFDQTGSYTNNDPGNVSGYAQPTGVDFDENNNVYITCFYSWTIDKWEYLGDLPVIELTIVTDIEKVSDIIPSEFDLEQNYPNPFNPATTLRFSIPRTSEITLSVYTVNGELVTELIEGVEYGAGVYELQYDASGLASGTYIYSISNGQSIKTKKMILLK